jgi:hypothetical protein
VGRAVRWLVTVLVAGALGCGESPSAPARTPHAIHYRLAWTWGHAVRVPDGWTVRTDRGFQVRVTRGYAVPFSIELVECPTPQPATSRVLDWLGAPPAYAFHSANAVNPATFRGAPVESLTAPVDREVGTITLQPQAYCQIHYLVARATRDSAGLPADVDMVDVSLYLEGSVGFPDGRTEQPLALRVTASDGRLAPLAAPIDTGTTAVRVTVSRDLGRLFDGIDFATTPAAVVGNRVLGNLVHTARLSAESVP